MRDPAVVSRIMAAIKSKETRPERSLAKAMWSSGLRYRKHYNIFGHPDFVFLGKKVAVFVDGDFWHGNNWRIRGMNDLETELSRYSDYWRSKIEKNISRDNEVNQRLRDQGWIVLRFWASQIEQNLTMCLDQIKSVLANNK